MKRTQWLGSAAVAVLGAVAVLTFGVTDAGAGDVTTPFAGKVVNGGIVTHETVGGKHVLTLSRDFQVPGSPDPHWQIVDSRGTVYVLDRLKLKDDKINTSITLPAYIPDVSKVQMWCAWAEVVLGEASFARPIVAHAGK